MNEGILLNAVASALAGLCFLDVALRAARDGSGGPRAVPAFLALAGAHLLLAGARQGVAYVGLLDGGAPGQDLALFYAASVAGTLPLLPLAHLAVREATGRAWAARSAVALLGTLAAFGLARLAAVGPVGPEVGFWGSEWRIEDDVLDAMLLGGLAAPALAACVALAVVARRREVTQARRARLVAASAALYFLALVPDAFGVGGAGFVVVRALAGASAMLAYHAYFARPPPAPPRRLLS